MPDFVETSLGSFYVEESGPATGRPIVFVAGLGDDHASWAEPISFLSGKYRCITFDNRGIGRSPVTDGPYTTRQLAEDVQAVADELGLRRLTAVGSSLGGAICQEWALARPDMIENLVLSNTWAGRDAWFTALIEQWIQLAGKGAGRDVLYQLALFCYSPGYLSTHPSTIDEFLETGMPDVDGFMAAGRACQTHDAIDRVSSIKVPALVIGGEHDILTRPDLSRALAAAMPKARLEWLPAGHMIFWECPQEWARLVAGLIEADSWRRDP
jgi:pimeloyl-ACP methyl ester carboxylesterase